MGGVQPQEHRALVVLTIPWVPRYCSLLAENQLLAVANGSYSLSMTRAMLWKVTHLMVLSASPLT